MVSCRRTEEPDRLLSVWITVMNSKTFAQWLGVQLFLNNSPSVAEFAGQRIKYNWMPCRMRPGQQEANYVSEIEFVCIDRFGRLG